MKWRPLRLKNPVMHYEWGQRGKGAFIPRLIGLHDWDENLPWAELWMGAHPKAPSRTEIEGREAGLDELIHSFPEELLGNRILNKFGAELPFLLKVLTAAEPLSIQAHPDAQRARELHRLQPEHYPDARHKPEIAIALENFECLVGIGSPEILENKLRKYPEIRKLVAEDIDPTRPDSERIFKKLISLSIDAPDRIEEAVNALHKRLLTKSRDSLERMEKLFLSLSTKYDHTDVGLLLIFLMNHLALTPGDAVYLGPGIPHAYISGAIVECMANSDNVVRAGLTPKHKDARTLLLIADCSSAPSVIHSASENPVTVYETPAPEFRVTRYNCREEYTVHIAPGTLPVMIFILEGKGLIRWGPGNSEKLTTGEVAFIPAALQSCQLGFYPGTIAFSVHVP
ncbi:mannose-6-phosphate isomerase, class I [Thermodesulforhabdus norvegica]|uniref:mannose-6-phosphate isomerase n=1 Tax=Thermodesulforhabdus norvegica TaxID=39841 RepID=A0A1I4SFD5_9BACT|nr:mannose-6-phosphate isomerase, class I [Thermodesulforhabdus norvegica]SFM63162.1 mannose-6-phosphate isomerase, type 1 [Thermodesulforhabdus norvegica]